MSAAKLMAAAALAVAVVLSPLLPATAAASRSSAIDLHHTSWTAEDGAPPFIIAIAQTPDGWLWLASANGVFRFDGAAFERFRPAGVQLMSNSVWAMRLLRSGALWIGYASGGASVWQDGKVRNFGAAEGLPMHTVYDFAGDADGRVWTATSRGLLFFDGRRWQKPGPGWGAPDGACTLLEAHDGSVWAQCESGAFRLPARALAFVQVPGPASMGRLVQGPDRAVWSVGGAKGDIVALDGAKRAPPAWPRPRGSGGTMMFERDGEHLWMTRADGLMRTGGSAGDEVFSVAHGLSGAIANTLFQDREGNVWVGTENGLDRFRHTALAGVTLPQIHTDSPPIAAGENGALWVGKTLVARPGQTTLAAVAEGTERDFVTALWREGPDSLWIGAMDGLWHQTGQQRTKIALPDEARSREILTIARDAEGALWIAVRRAGIYRLSNGVWSKGGGYAQLAREAKCLYADGDGRMWFGLRGDELLMLEHGRLHQYGNAQGLRVVNPVQILGRGKTIWVAGEDGLFHFDGQKFTPIVGAGGESMLGVSGMLEVNGALWLNSASGIIVIAMTELERAVGDAQYRVALRRFDHRDGLRGTSPQGMPRPSAIAGSDGVLWFSTTAGIFWLDPAKIGRNALAPPVYVRRVSAGGLDTPLDAGQAAHLPPHADRIQIDYTALSLTMPERMQFRYRLDGVDRQWQDAGTGRSAVYTGLAPGDYRFQVMAANNDGVWSEHAALAQIHLAPAFYQTVWFRMLAALAIAGALWGLYKLRLMQVARQVRARTEEKHMERERISRELHDTVLQSVQALVLQVHVASERLPAAEPGRAAMARALAMAERTISEGRDRIRGLRARPDQQADLVSALHDALAGHAGASTELLIRATGSSRRLHAAVFDEALAIACEAALNALRHARSEHVCCELDYGDALFTLVVRDDGMGIPADIIAAGHRSGHWGMVGMQERARRIGASLVLVAGEGGGTRWELTLAATLAYEATLA